MTAAGLPNTFVPGRNLLFFTYAAALAYRRGIRTLVGGMCETDYSGYPDCRNETLQSLAGSISLGMAAAFTIETPLMWIDKAATWELADKLGGQRLVELIVEHTHTCYTPDRTTRHPWGYGCGHCPACGLRAKRMGEMDEHALIMPLPRVGRHAEAMDMDTLDARGSCRTCDLHQRRSRRLRASARSTATRSPWTTRKDRFSPTVPTAELMARAGAAPHRASGRAAQPCRSSSHSRRAAAHLRLAARPWRPSLASGAGMTSWDRDCAAANGAGLW